MILSSLTLGLEWAPLNCPFPASFHEDLQSWNRFSCQKQHQLKQFQIKIKGNWRKGPFPKITAITFCIFTWCWGNPWAVSVCCCSKLSVVPSDCTGSSSDWSGNKTLGSSVWKIKNQWYNKKVISITEICNTEFPWHCRKCIKYLLFEILAKAFILFSLSKQNELKLDVTNKYRIQIQRICSEWTGY